MARPALHTTRYLSALVAIILLGLPSVAPAQLAASPPGGAIAVPEREHLPLGAAPVATGPDAPAPASGFLPGAMEMVRVGGALAGVVALLLGLRYILRRMGGMPLGRRPAGVVQVHARYPVARGQQIVLLQVGRRLIVTHQGGGTMRTLSEITDPVEVASLRGALDAGGHASSASSADFQKDLAKATAESSGRVVDLTQPTPVVEPRRPRAQGSRLPGWRSGS